MDEQTIDDLEARRARAREMGGAERVQKLHDAGKLSARERLDLLLDPGSFVELGLLAHSQRDDLKDRTPADGMIAGHGTIEGRIVYVAADDGSVLAGTRGRVAEVKNARIRELALRHKKPFIALMEAGAARVQETFGATAAGLGLRFGDHMRMSGRVPQVGAAMGPCFGGPSFTALQSDYLPIVKGTGFIGMSGPPVVKVGIGLEVSAEEIGGGEMSAGETGQADFAAENEAECLLSIRRFLSYLPSNSDEAPPMVPARPALAETDTGAVQLTDLVPDNHRRAYDMQDLIRLLVDQDSFFELKQAFGRSLIIGFARMEGAVIGIIANQPRVRAGTIDETAAEKMRWFIDLCDAYHVPLVFLQDCPGFLVGPEIERKRMVALTARLMNSVISASVPKVTIIIRKAIGLAYIALGGRAVGPDTIVAWPKARFDVMGPEAGIELVYGREIASDPDPEAKRAEIRDRVEAGSSAYATAGMGLIDDVIKPLETRAVILDALALRRDTLVPGFKHRIDP